MSAFFNQARFLGRFIVSLMAFVALAGAAAAQPFTVKNVEIDATAGSAAEAQTQALSRGQLQAANILIERLTLPEDRIAIGPDLIDGQTAPLLIAGLQIADEQRSATRYRANLTLEFDRRAVAQFFDALGLPFVQSPAAPVLVVAVSDEGAGPTLSGGWARAWAQGAFETSLTPFLVYNAGDAGDLLSVSAALSMNEGALRMAAELYGVDAVAVITARSGGGAVRTGGNVMRFTEEGAIVEPLPGLSAFGGYADAAQRFVTEQEMAWKRAAIVRDTAETELSITVLYGSLREWRGLQRAVAGAALIEDARLDALSRRGAAMTLIHRGSLDQVQAELAARGASLEEDADLGWTVRSRR